MTTNNYPNAVIHCLQGDNIDDDVSSSIDKAAVEIWYVYEVGDYCGTGELIACNGRDEWAYASLSHCSCYGPTEDLGSLDFSPRVEFIKTISADLGKLLKDILLASGLDGVLSWPENK